MASSAASLVCVLRRQRAVLLIFKEIRHHYIELNNLFLWSAELLVKCLLWLGLVVLSLNVETKTVQLFSLFVIQSLIELCLQGFWPTCDAALSHHKLICSYNLLKTMQAIYSPLNCIRIYKYVAPLPYGHVSVMARQLPCLPNTFLNNWWLITICWLGMTFGTDSGWIRMIILGFLTSCSDPRRCPVLYQFLPDDF